MEDGFLIALLSAFGIKEIKQFIKIIGGNPRAVASRLTGKKENK